MSNTMEKAVRRSLKVLESPPPTILVSSGPSSVNGDDEISSDLPSVSMLGNSGRKKQATRESLSSVATLNDYNESSDYSTPATSAFATPAPIESEAKPTIARRGRRPATKAADDHTNGVSAVARAAALRNSRYAMNSYSNKRKRNAISDDEEHADEDDSPDAQLARALQEQENAAATAAADTMMGSENGSGSRRPPRKARKVLPRSDYNSDLEGDDLDADMIGFPSAPQTSKKVQIEIGSKGSNNVSFTSRRRSNMVIDTDDSDDFIEIDDSEDDEPIFSMSTPRSRMKQVTQTPSDHFKAEDHSPGHHKLPPPARARFTALLSKHFPRTTGLEREDTRASTASSALSSLGLDSTESEFYSDVLDSDIDSDASDLDDVVVSVPTAAARTPRSGRAIRQDLNLLELRANSRAKTERARLELHHPELNTMWNDLENLPKIGSVKIEQPTTINRELKPFQLEGVAWMKAMEETEWGGGLLGDEMGMGKTIQAVSLIMSDWPAKQPSLVLIPPVALMQWQQEIADYTDGTLKTFVFHGTNAQTKGVTVQELMKYNVILMSYNSLESMYRKQEKGFKRKNGMHKEKSVIHKIHFHRVILDEAHNIKVSGYLNTLVP